MPMGWALMLTNLGNRPMLRASGHGGLLIELAETAEQ